MSEPASLPQFENEDEFRKWYLQLPSAQSQIRALHAWRLRQSRIVGALGHIIGHFGGEQYTEVDHFILELLQNADDNTYSAAITPEIIITLERTRCVFECNESGFTADNVFAVCYAAASTKRRQPGKHSFIGEKGIGFKSLFAVAEAVEIHSGDYHFELRDKEYIVPHLLSGKPQSGSRIVVRFKREMDEIAMLLSERLLALSRSAEHFVLFLQRLERLTIDDQTTGSKITVQILREGERCVVQQGAKVSEYRMIAETIRFPENIVWDRFEHLAGELEREVRFAVPYPTELDTKTEPGLLFCFLPTRVASGFPFHIQLDGKTTTNRENIESVARSKWNRHLMGKLPDIIRQLFLKLRDDRDFQHELPRYFPDPKSLQVGNDDLKQVLALLLSSLRQEPLALDRNKQFRPLASLCFAPIAIAEWVETDQYAPHLGKDREFLNFGWRKHREVLANYGCAVLTAEQSAELFVKGGTPSALLSSIDEKMPRDFLDKWITLRASTAWEIVKLKAAPIYPIKDGQTRRWDAINEKTLLVSLDGREVPVPSGHAILDPVFTYSPGGNVHEAIRSFNERFRTYLTDVLNVKRSSDAQYLEDVLIPNVQFECEKPVVDEATLINHTERWVALFNRVWWRQKTIIGDSSQERFQDMLRRIGQCKIVVGSKDRPGWFVIPICDAFLPSSWWSDQALSKVYAAAGAPMIELAINEYYASTALRSTRNEPKFDLHEWRLFLLACNAAQGPRLTKTGLPSGDDLPKTIADLRDQCDNVDSSGRIKTVTTIDFDSITCRLLASSQPPECLMPAISRLWTQITDTKTVIEWYYRSSRSYSVSNNAARCRIDNHLPLSSDQGQVLPSMAALDNENNRAVAIGLVPLINPARYENEDFLRYIGVSGKIDEAWLETRAQMAMSEVDDKQFLSEAALVVRIAARLAKHRPEGRTWIRTAKIFPHCTNRVLMNYDEWIDQKGDIGFPSELTNEILESLEAVFDMPLANLVSDLFTLENFVGRNAEVVAWLKAVGLFLRTGHRNEIALEFSNQLRDRRMRFDGNLVSDPNCLPPIWNAFPNPCSSTGFIILPEEQADRSACELAAQVVGWPRMSTKTIHINCVSQEDISEVTRKQIQLVAGVLESKFSGVHGSRLRRSAVMRLAREGRLDVFQATTITLKLDDCTETPQVSFWVTKGGLLFDPEHLTLPEALGRVTDFQVGTTITPFIESIFDQQLLIAKQTSAKLPTIATPAASSSSPVTESTATPSDVPASTIESNTSNSQTASSTSIRKRLFSYVVARNEGDTRTEREPTSGSKIRTDVELAGEKLLINFCTKHGLNCKDVTSENKGYDFEINSGNGLFLVELKSSRDQWRGWENAMTPNELKSAIQHADNFVLCVAEQVLGDNGSLTFIQNPWGQTEYFLFDSPWKKVAVHPSHLFSILEDAPGAPPSRDAETA